VLSDVHRYLPGLKNPDEQDVESYVPGLPVVSFRFSDEFKQKNPEIQQKWVQTLLRTKGWIVPNYELAPDLQSIEILRVVVRENMSETLLDRLVADIVEITEDLAKSDSALHSLASLGTKAANSARKHEGRMDDGSGSQSSGTYAKQC